MASLCDVGLLSTAAKVTTRMLDSAAASDMASLGASPHHPPLGTVVHAGGVLRDGMLANQSAGTLREVGALFKILGFRAPRCSGPCHWGRYQNR